MPLEQHAEASGSAAVTDQQPNQPPGKKRTAKHYAIAFFLKTGITALVIWLLLTFVAGIYVCHTRTAYPMIKDGDLCVTYRLADLRQGDEIAYRADGQIRFGRIIAFGGDTVEIYQDYITVNGFGIFDDVVYATSPEGSAISYPYQVPDHCVFVLNDYRSDVSDSRTLGGIPLGSTCGKIVFIMRRRGI